MTGNGRNLVLLRSHCEPCGGTGVVELVEHWTGLDTSPARVACPHCHYPWLPIQTYFPRKAS